MREEWMSIPNHPDYAVSNLGRVKRLTAKQGTWPGKILKPRMNGDDSGNYFFVSIPDSSGEYFGKAMGRLVAHAFIPNPENKPEVNHIDGDKANNRSTNLEWATRKEQMVHASQTGLVRKGSENLRSKLKEKDVPVIRSLRVRGGTYQSIADKFGVNHHTIMDVITGRTWSHV